MAHEGEYGKGMEAGGDYGFKGTRKAMAKKVDAKKKKKKIPTVMSY